MIKSYTIQVKEGLYTSEIKLLWILEYTFHPQALPLSAKFGVRVLLVPFSASTTAPTTRGETENHNRYTVSSLIGALSCRTKDENTWHAMCNCKEQHSCTFFQQNCNSYFPKYMYLKEKDLSLQICYT